MKKNNLNIFKTIKTKKYLLSFFIILIALIISFKIIKINSNISTNSTMTYETKKSNNINYNINTNRTPTITEEFLNRSLIETIKINKLNSLNNEQQKILDYQNVEKIVSDIIENEEKDKITKDQIKILTDVGIREEIFYIILIQNIINTKMTQLKELDANNFQNIENYFRNIYKKLDETFILLKNVNPPEFWAEDHLELLNLFNKHRKIFEAFSKSKEDPLKLLIYSYKIFEIDDPVKEYQAINTRMLNKFKKAYEK